MHFGHPALSLAIFPSSNQMSPDFPSCLSYLTAHTHLCTCSPFPITSWINLDFVNLVTFLLIKISEFAFWSSFPVSLCHNRVTKSAWKKKRRELLQDLRRIKRGTTRNPLSSSGTIFQNCNPLPPEVQCVKCSETWPRWRKLKYDDHYIKFTRWYVKIGPINTGRQIFRRFHGQMK